MKRVSYLLFVSVISDLHKGLQYLGLLNKTKAFLNG